MSRSLVITLALALGLAPAAFAGVPEEAASGQQEGMGQEAGEEAAKAASEGAASDEATGEEAPDAALVRRDEARLAALAAAGLERRTLATERGALVYWTGGAGSPLVLLHGAGDSAGGWAAVVPELVAEHTLLVPDLAGHGASEPREGALPMATVVAGMEALLEEFARQHPDLGPPVLAGNSMGAWLAMLQAFNHPDAVARVVAINGGAILGEPTSLTLMPADREQARTVMAALRDPASPPLPDEVLDGIVYRSGRGPIARMMADLPGMMGYFLDGRLGELATPVDLLWGASDGLMKVSYAEKMAAALPRARLTLVPQCGHIPMAECPERFVALLRQVLAEEPPPLKEAPPAAADPADTTRP